jgi:hypothetical protein
MFLCVHCVKAFIPKHHKLAERPYSISERSWLTGGCNKDRKLGEQQNNVASLHTERQKL